MRTNAYKGGGGLTHEVSTQSKKLSAFVYILQYIHLQRTLHKQLINEVLIQLKLLLVQGCQAYGPQAESDNVAPRNFE